MKISLKRQYHLFGFLLSLPSILLFCLIILYPIYSLVRSSFLRYESITNPYFVGLENYVWVLKNPVFYITLKNTFIMTAIVVSIPTIVGLVLAGILYRDITGRNFFKLILLIPSMIAYVVLCVTFYGMMKPSGLLTWLVGFFTPNPISFLGDERLALYSCSLLSVWGGIPFSMLYFVAALEAIPSEVLDAAKVDGATGLKTWWNILLPYLMSTISVVLILRTISAINIFTSVYLLTAGGPLHSSEMFSTWTFKSALELFYFGRGSAMAVVHTIIVMAISVFYIRLLWRER